MGELWSPWLCLESTVQPHCCASTQTLSPCWEQQTPPSHPRGHSTLPAIPCPAVQKDLSKNMEWITLFPCLSLPVASHCPQNVATVPVPAWSPAAPPASYLLVPIWQHCCPCCSTTTLRTWLFPLPGLFFTQISPSPFFWVSISSLPQQGSLTKLFSLCLWSTLDHQHLIVSMTIVAPKTPPGDLGSCLSPMNETSLRSGALCVSATLVLKSLQQVLVSSMCLITVGLMNIDCSLCARHWLSCPRFRDEWLFYSQNR